MATRTWYPPATGRKRPLTGLVMYQARRLGMPITFSIRWWAQGITLIAAAGDRGSTPGCGDADRLIWPSADPDFLSAGGTALKLNYDGTWLSEMPGPVALP